MADRFQLMLKKGGVIPLTRKLLKLLNAVEGEKYDVVFVDDGYLFLARAGEREKKVSIMGDLEHTNIADVFSILSMSQRTGALHILDEGKRKTIYFKGGEIVFASTNEKQYLIGQVLYKIGLISEKALEEAEREIETSSERFGNILIKKGYITPKEMWAGVKYQLEEIVYSAFEVEKGHFVFLEGEEPPEDVVRFSLNTQNLLMEGFRRMDERSLFKKAIPSLDARVRINPEKTPSGLSETLLKVYQVIEDGITVSEIIRRTRLGEFNTLKLLHNLVSMGFVFVEGAEEVKQKADRAEIRNTILRYNTLFTKIITYMEESGVKIDFKKQLEDFIKGLPEKVRELFHEVEFDRTGYFDPDAVIENAERIYITDNVKFLNVPEFSELLLTQHIQEGLKEVLSFLLVTARSYLSESDYDELLRETYEIREELEKA